jgi:hypothetical protein
MHWGGRQVQRVHERAGFLLQTRGAQALQEVQQRSACAGSMQHRLAMVLLDAHCVHQFATHCMCCNYAVAPSDATNC